MDVVIGVGAVELYSRIGLTIEKYAADFVSSLLTLRLRLKNP